MTRLPPELDDYAAFAAALRNLELARITGKNTTYGPGKRPMQVWGLALSGGGIRSATFCLGVLQGLAQRGLLGAFHYCSTVSGGGYIGGYLQAMIRRKKWDDTIRSLVKQGVPQPPLCTGQTPPARPPSSGFTDSVLDLRRYSNFLTPNKRFLSGDRIAMVATYLSNMLLTWLQLGALLLLASLLPMLIVRGLAEVSRTPLLLWGAAIAVAVLALSSRPRLAMTPRHDREKVEAMPPPEDAKNAPSSRSGSPPKDIMRAVTPALLAAVFLLLATLVWVAPACPQGTCMHGYELFAHTLEAGFGVGLPLGPQALANSMAGIVVSTTYLVGFLAWLRWWWPGATRHDDRWRRLGLQVLWGLLAALALGWATQEVALRTELLARPFLGVALGTPLLFAMFFVANLLHQSLSYRKGDAVARERWTRLMGRTAIWIVGAITLPIALTVVAPAYLLPLLLPEPGQTASSRTAWATLTAIWSVISGTGVLAAYRDESLIPKNMRGRILRVLIGIAFWVFLAGVAVGVGMLAYRMAIGGANLATWPFEGPQRDAIVAMIAAAVAWGVLAYFINENEFSMNGFYRNRLVRCYLAPSRGRAERDWETQLDPDGDDLVLSDVVPAEGPVPRPLYPLVCCAVNIVKTERLDWQDRKSASFVFSPLYCGHQPLPGGQTGPIGDPLDKPALLRTETGLNSSKLAGEHTLGAAMSVSGAAISPNMGYHSSAGATALLTLFNARLGWWVENHNAPGSSIYFAGQNLLSELLGNTRENSRHVHVSDGGHFENTGIYELVRRQCRFILAVDATADPRRKFGDLANAVRKCRIDFGAEIDIDTSLLAVGENGISDRCAALGKIAYSDGQQGVLLYIKPSLVGSESADVANYARSHSAFPHEPTHDQFFDEAQFECYRQLGYDTTLNVFDEKVRGVRTPDKPMELDDDDKEELVRSLTYRLYEPSSATAAHYARHADELIALLERLRCSGNLAFLDRQLYPSLQGVYPRVSPWETAERPAQGEDSAAGKKREPKENFPEDKEFRDCFYFVQQLIQLMESVYLDLDLERNWNHPDNRGWMNKFRHWSWVPMYRLVWSATLQSLGPRFVRFCETHLGLPRIDTACEGIEWIPVRDKDHLCVKIAELYDAGKINLVERDILLSAEVRRHAEMGRMQLGLLRFSRNAFLRSVVAQPNLADMRIGVAVVVEEVSGPNLIVLRIQDHLRRLGFGLAFMRKVVRRFPSLVRVDLGEGNFGKAIDPNLVAAQREDLAMLLVRARIAEGKVVERERAAAAGAKKAAAS